MTINNLQNNKTPGPNGLTPEFFLKSFQNLLVDPLLKMLSHSFDSNNLPSTMMHANIPLILKRGKPVEECASYRPIALLDVDRKILAKILAKKLEQIPPDLIAVDQTGFIAGCHSCNNVRRLLNLIQYGTTLKTKCLVVLTQRRPLTELNGHIC
ncbi:hypothetical protein LDENG_00057590 [Lucifuga dentata]|nr:hypothetical protein LDENG_00057590 [Lucifuga dentata]